MGTKYVSFVVGDGHYAIPLEEVSQIIRYETPTEVPSAPGFVRGVITLADEVVPLIDLRQRFAVPTGPATRRSRVIVTEREGRRYALLVDAVRAILDLEEENVSRDVTAVFGLKAELVRGVAKIRDNLLVLLDIFRVLAAGPDVPFREPAS